MQTLIKVYSIHTPSQDGHHGETKNFYFSPDYPQQDILEMIGEEAVYRGMIDAKDAPQDCNEVHTKED